MTDLPHPAHGRRYWEAAVRNARNTPQPPPQLALDLCPLCDDELPPDPTGELTHWDTRHGTFHAECCPHCNGGAA